MEEGEVVELSFSYDGGEELLRMFEFCNPTLRSGGGPPAKLGIRIGSHFLEEQIERQGTTRGREVIRKSSFS